MRRVILILTGVLVAAAFVAGCGGGSGSSDSGTAGDESSASTASAGGASDGAANGDGTESTESGGEDEAGGDGAVGGSEDEAGGDGAVGGSEGAAGGQEGGGAIVGKGPFKGDGGAASSAAPLTKATLIKQGDEICRKGGETIRTDIQRNKEQYGMGFGNQPNKKQREEVIIDIVLPVLATQTEEIAALGAPKGEEATVEAIVTALEKGVKATEEDPSVALTGPNPFNEASKLSKQYGFTLCG